MCYRGLFSIASSSVVSPCHLLESLSALATLAQVAFFQCSLCSVVKGKTTCVTCVASFTEREVFYRKRIVVIGNRCIVMENIGLNGET